MAEPASKRLSYAEYVDLVERSGVRHEFFDGEVVAMSGGTPEHALVQANVVAILHARLRGRPCRVYGPDLSVWIPTARAGTYPDATVVCGPLQRDPEADRSCVNPTLIVEVLSPSTEAWDRGGKFALYRALPSLLGYVLADPKASRVEVYRRLGEGRWELTVHGPGDTVILPAVEVRLAVDELYEGVDAAG